ncbi:fungal-specific transcription factor domain-containing protein [Aspergillus multicolor]|uniref:transcription factor domain-containing protein n=1 Tax=Aspergillus multicolor TaxID=41759 RepID=UPI003CCCBF7D
MTKTAPSPTASSRTKRSYIACRRCHGLKVKCSGGVPCQRCRNAKKAVQCSYPLRERRVTVSASYLNQLQRNNGDPPSPRVELALDSDRPEPAAIDLSNPIHEPRRLFQLDHTSQPQFVGESTCLAFSDRILQCLNPRSTPTPPPERRYVRNPAFARQSHNVTGCKLPERIRTYLLVRVALRFIGQDYHFFLHGDFLQQLDEAYRLGERFQWDSTWACKLFVVLALGELYSCSTSAPALGDVDASSSPVPGTGYFLVAVGLLQDLFEEPSLAQIEIMLLLCFYSNALGRVNSAHMYSSMALRLSTSLGLHRAVLDGAGLSSIEREHRVRLWWTVYVFDRSTCSKLGQPIGIHDDDIDVELPSPEPSAVPGSPIQMRLGRAEHLVAHVELARITGLIMRDIYAPSSKAAGERLVHNVRSVLRRLHTWDTHIPESLRWNQDAGILRSVASLQLHFNHCIILTTRPILLYVLKVRNPFAQSLDHSEGSPEPALASAPISDTTRTLADACISAARTSNSILSQLFIDSSLATFGYFDAHHLFSSTLILIISAIISPNLGDSDAVQTAFQMLMTMRDKGNATAGQYYSRLVQIQWNVGRLVGRVPSAVATASDDSPTGINVQPYQTGIKPGPMDNDGYDWSNFLMPGPMSFTFNPDDGLARNTTTTVDPLDSPFLQAFLNCNNVERGGEAVIDGEEMGFVL